MRGDLNNKAELYDWMGLMFLAPFCEEREFSYWKKMVVLVVKALVTLVTLEK